MCLAVPGRILAISSAEEDDDALWHQAEVDFGGVRQTVSLACLSEVQVGIGCWCTWAWPSALWMTLHDLRRLPHHRWQRGGGAWPIASVR
jgi:hydrogenase expression/formation protein HypC